MSFLKKLFGGGPDGGQAPATAAKEVEHNGFTIKATPFAADGQFQCCGVVSKAFGGEVREHTFIRADRFSSADEAGEFALRKGRQLVDEQGDRIFG